MSLNGPAPCLISSAKYRTYLGLNVYIDDFTRACEKLALCNTSSAAYDIDSGQRVDRLLNRRLIQFNPRVLAITESGECLPIRYKPFLELT